MDHVVATAVLDMLTNDVTQHTPGTLRKNTQ